MIDIMLDTNIVIYVMKRKPISVLTKFNQHAQQLCVSSITAAELFYGAEYSTRTAHNLRQVEDFLSRLIVLPYDVKAAYHFGNIRATLAKQGNIIGENNLHIAAHARSEGLKLITNNLREFERVDGLRLDNWVD